MKKQNRKYPQLVFSQMHRFKNDCGGYYLDYAKECFLVRNNTQILFGEARNIIGSVIMTNPGSYGLDEIDGWKAFKMGAGIEPALAGYGYADLTMQNIIQVINEAFDEVGKMPNGYVNIYNISSAVCPKGKKVDKYHAMISEIISHHGFEENLLEDPVVRNREAFLQMCDKSPFVIMGFLKEAFNDSAQTLLQWAEKYQNKIVSPDKSGWPSHPRRWRTEKYLSGQAKRSLINIISSVSYQ